MTVLALTAHAVEPERERPWTDCPAANDRGEIIQTHSAYRSWGGGGHTFVDRRSTKLVEPIRGFGEGRNVILECDSYPRQRGSLVEGPALEKVANGYRIRFAVDRFDDVIVRVVDGAGSVVRTLACGVLGPNAPEPLQRGSLKQELIWDGKRPNGIEVANGWSIQVGVGCTPKLERFIGYSPQQLTDYLMGLAVDRKGRVYATLHTAHRFDPVMLRFDREGNYIDMVYPSDPAVLKASGRRLRDVYDPVERMDGRDIPIKESTWRYWLQRWDQYMRWPAGIAPTGEWVYLDAIEGSYEMVHDLHGEVLRPVMVEDTEHFWFQPSRSGAHFGSMIIPPGFAGMAFDKAGHAYYARKRLAGVHGATRPRDGRTVGSVIKVQWRTGMPVRDFTHHGRTALDEPAYWLGKPTSLRREERADFARRYEPVLMAGERPEVGEDDTDAQFVDIEDIAVDDDGNILVIDGLPRRIKCYNRRGEWLGEADGLAVRDRHRLLHDAISIEATTDAVYVLTSFYDDRDGPVYLCKLPSRSSWAGSRPHVQWALPLAPESRFLAVDCSREPVVVWVGNGGGRNTMTRVTDLGQERCEFRHIGGIGEDALIYPWTVAVSRSERIFVHDYGRNAIVAMNADGSNRSELPLPRNPVRDRSEKHRRYFEDLDVECRNAEYTPVSMYVDDANQRLLVQFQQMDADAKGLVQAYDFQLRPVLEGDGKGHGGLTSFGRTFFGGVCDDGSFHLSSPVSKVFRVNEGRENDYTGSVVGIGPDGTIIEGKQYRLYKSGGSLCTDSQGNLYAVDLLGGDPRAILDLTTGFPNATPWWTTQGEAATRATCVFERNGRPIWHQPEVCYVVKFGPNGGDRGTDTELWAHRGGFAGAVCGWCDFHANLLACDGADRIMVGDVVHYGVEVLDTAGNQIQRFGTYGNAATMPGADSNAKDLGFRNIYSIDAAGDLTYIVDKDLRRLAVVRMAYRETRTCSIE
jgi:hypothetical protein